MQEEFKVGDRVETTAKSSGSEYYLIGEVGTIHHISACDGWPIVYFDVDDGESYVNPQHLKKIKE